MAVRTGGEDAVALEKDGMFKRESARERRGVQYIVFFVVVFFSTSSPTAFFLGDGCF